MNSSKRWDNGWYRDGALTFGAVTRMSLGWQALDYSRVANGKGPQILWGLTEGGARAQFFPDEQQARAVVERKFE